MPGSADAYRTKIDGDDVEGGVGSALYGEGETARKGVDPKGLQGIDHHAACSAAAQGLHQGGGQGIYKTGINAQMGEEPGYPVDEVVHGPGGPEYANGYQNGDEVGDDFYGDAKTFFAAFYKGFVNIYFFQHGPYDKQGDEAEEGEVGYEQGDDLQLIALELREAPNEGADCRCQAPQVTQNHFVVQFDALHQGDGEHAGQGGEEGGQEDGQEDVGGIGGSKLGTVHHNGDGDDGESRGVEHQKHDLGIGGRLLMGIYGLHFFHGL